MIHSILDKIDAHIPLSLADTLTLLEVPETSEDFYQLLAKANAQTRAAANNRGYIFVQMGIESAPCSGNCAFCTLAASNFLSLPRFQTSCEQILHTVRVTDFSLVDAFFLMTTADYPLAQLAEIGAQVRKILPEHVMLVANTGDFDLTGAKLLKQSGFQAAYHIVRLREGIDTDLPVEQRVRTLDAIVESGLELFYCVEPIGPEHSYEEIAAEMLRARNYHVNVMAVMARVPVPSTPFASSLPRNPLEMVKIAAVTRLVVNPKRSMNIHEPNPMALLAGVNQLYAEIGTNPRDRASETASGRGYSIPAIAEMLSNAQFSLRGCMVL